MHLTLYNSVVPWRPFRFNTLDKSNVRQKLQAWLRTWRNFEHFRQRLYHFTSGVNYKRYHVSMLLIRRARSFLRRGHRSMTISHNAIPTSQKPLKPPRKPARSGQNLSERYKRLENAVRGREALTRSLEVLSKATPAQGRPVLTASSTVIPTFHGFQVPQEPKPPTDDGILLFFVLSSSKNVTRLVRMLHVRLCYLRIRPLRRISCSLPGCCQHLASISDCCESAWIRMACQSSNHNERGGN